MNLNEQLRAAIRADMIANDIPAGEVAETIDLAFHAVDEALSRLFSAVHPAANARARDNALSLALSILVLRAELARNKMHGMLAAEGGTATCSYGVAGDGIDRVAQP